MAFTEITFSRLRESVKQSMLEDKQNGKITGQIISKTQNTLLTGADLLKHVLSMVLCNTPLVVDDEIKQRIVGAELKNGEVFVDIASSDNPQVEKHGKAKRSIKLGRALRYLTCASEFSDVRIKAVVNSVNSGFKTHYIMFTDRDINIHYRVLAVTQNHKSCMSRPPKYYDRVRPDTTYDDPSWVRYIHPTEAYNNSPNLRLALVTTHHPDSEEFNEGYPFMARAIVKISDCSNKIQYGRAYGNETATDIIKCCLDHAQDLDGGILQRVEDRCGNLVAPYVDPDNRLELFGDRIEINSNGNYEVEHSSGELQNIGHYCEHCNEYHDCDEDEFIYVSGVGNVYGSCQDEYSVPIGHNFDYHLTDDMYWSECHEGYLIEEDAVEYITYVSSSGGVDTDYAHRASLGNEVVELAQIYNGEYYADVDLCIVTDQGNWYLADYQTDLYAEVDEVYHDVYNCRWSKYHGSYILVDDALRTPDGDDWVLETALEAWKEENDYVNDAA